MKEVVGDSCPFDADKAFSVPGGPRPEGDECDECGELRVLDGICAVCGHFQRRRRLSELNMNLLARSVVITRVIDNGKDTLLFHPYGRSQEVFFRCSPDDIFDCDGNRFEGDLDYKEEPVASANRVTRG